jgi:hypothetical protein
MKNREFLMLAKDYEEGRDRVPGMFVSEKIDGMRAIWLPRFRGMPISDVSWANADKKLKDRKCTGLFSRYGNVISAPDWFLDQLPTDILLDGELTAGRGAWEKTISTVRKHEPVDSEWHDIMFMVFDSPSYQQVFQDGRINNVNYKKELRWAEIKAKYDLPEVQSEQIFRIIDIKYNGLLLRYSGPHISANCEIIKQTTLPFKQPEASAELAKLLAEVLDNGGEGLILRLPSSEWEPRRSPYVFKLKAERDSEATVIGYTFGLGKHHGRLGSLRCLWSNNGSSVEFDLGGFTDEERILTKNGAFLASQDQNAGKSWPGPLFVADPLNSTPAYISDKFPLRFVVSFKYRELTDDGKPKEARFWRDRPKGT